MKAIGSVFLVLLFAARAHAADHAVSAVHGTVEKIDSGTKTIVVKTADGARHSLVFTEKTTVHGPEEVVRGAEERGKESWHGISKGSEVAVHYAKNGAEHTAVEVDKLGKDGLKATEGTVKTIDRDGKTVVVKTADGAEETFHLTERAAVDAGKGVGKGTEKGSQVVVYSSEQAGKKVAHFFEKL